MSAWTIDHEIKSFVFTENNFNLYIVPIEHVEEFQKKHMIKDFFAALSGYISFNNLPVAKINL